MKEKILYLRIIFCDSEILFPKSSFSEFSFHIDLPADDENLRNESEEAKLQNIDENVNFTNEELKQGRFEVKCNICLF